MGEQLTLRRLSEHTFRAHLQADSLADAVRAFASILKRPPNTSYSEGEFGIPDGSLVDLASQSSDTTTPHKFFSENFSAFEIVGSSHQVAHFTGFFEPELEGSRYRTDAFKIPILARPHDLAKINSHDQTHLPSGWRFGLQMDTGEIGEYHDRRAIENGVLANRGLELFWLRDAIEAFFLHIQGAGLIHLSDGTKARVTYAAKSGHPFTGIGKILIENGEIAGEDISMNSIKAWLRAHPNQAKEVMRQNRSYIFFRETEFDKDHSGPIAAAKVPLAPLRSIAVDRLIHTFGTPFFVEADSVNGKRMQRLMFAHDTGSAIVGAARADLYFGTGEKAGNAASAVNTAGKMTVLVPNECLDRVASRHHILEPDA